MSFQFGATDILFSSVAALFYSVPVMAGSVSSDNVGFVPPSQLSDARVVLPDLGGQAAPYASLLVIPGEPPSREDGAASTLPRQGLGRKAADSSLAKMPTVSASIGDDSTVALSPSATNMNFKSERSKLNIAFGLGYSRQEDGNSPHSPFSASASGATLLSQNLAVGADSAYSNLWREIVFNGAYRPKASPFLFFGSWGYARGNQNFDFGSGEVKGVKMAQNSYLGGFTYAPKSLSRESNDGLQSVGIKAWGAKAAQRDDYIDAPSIRFSETDSSYVYYVNNYKLSIGRLSGVNLNGQYAFSENIVARASLGYEVVTYPFQDGSVERDSKIYRSLEAYFQPGWLRGVVVGGRYKAYHSTQLITHETRASSRVL